MDFETMASVGASLAAVIGAMYGLLRYVITNITNPISRDMERLASSIADFSAVIEKVTDRLHGIELDMATVKNRVALIDHMSSDMSSDRAAINDINERMRSMEKGMAVMERSLAALHNRLDASGEQLQQIDRRITQWQETLGRREHQ